MPSRNKACHDSVAARPEPFSLRVSRESRRPAAAASAIENVVQAGASRVPLAISSPAGAAARVGFGRRRAFAGGQRGRQRLSVGAERVPTGRSAPRPCQIRPARSRGGDCVPHTSQGIGEQCARPWPCPRLHRARQRDRPAGFCVGVPAGFWRCSAVHFPDDDAGYASADLVGFAALSRMVRGCDETSL